MRGGFLLKTLPLHQVQNPSSDLFFFSVGVVGVQTDSEHTFWHANPSGRASLMAQRVGNPTAMQEIQETQVQYLGQEDPLEKDMVTHTSICP